jgi:predicted MPP superfamily phosphohydrolase
VLVNGNRREPMKIAAISDTHFGDPMCALVDDKGVTHWVSELLMTIDKEVDYLLLLGDIFDFSVASYSDAYAAAGLFFEALTNAKAVNKAIVYVPGNHDFDFWHMVEHEVNVIRRISDRTNPRPPRDFRWSVPGIFDFRESSAQRGFHLPFVTRRPPTEGSPYGGLFLDGLTKWKIPFYVAYPNCYLVTDSLSVVFTHGHYLELFWSLVGEFGLKIAGNDLGVGDLVDLKELVAINFPLNQLASSGVGQAGPLTDLVRKIQREVKEGKLGRIERYLNNLDDNIIDVLLGYGWYDPREWVSDLALNKSKEELLKGLKGHRTTRFNTEFTQDKAVKQRLFRYYQASTEEIRHLNQYKGYATPKPITNPDHFVFGHTHEPVPWDSASKYRIDDNAVRVHNTGGWLYRNDEDNQKVNPGAEVFVFDSITDKMESFCIQ